MARAGMIDRPAAADLRTRDRAVYGESRPDGPEFDDLYAAARARGLSEDDAYRDIIASSTRSNPGYNARTGVPGHRFSIRGPRREPRPRLFPENTLTSDRPTLPMGTPADPYAE
jgi:hypothetical protein